MKKTAIIILALTVVVSCKTLKKAETSDSSYQTTLNDNTPAKVFSVPDSNNIDEPAPPVEKSITIKKEAVTFTEKEDESKNKANNFFVIVGSFSNIENAKNYRNSLISEGFIPIILHSTEVGFYRVCVNSYKNEMNARERVHQIRKDFPEHFDSWLLIKE